MTRRFDVPPLQLPLALADRHRSMAVGDRLEVVVPDGGRPPAGRPARGRSGDPAERWPRQRLIDVVVGAGFEEVAVRGIRDDGGSGLHVSAVRARTLADLVASGMRMLVCGLNPSRYAADAGVPFARPGNRFWPALLAAGLAEVDRDARHLLLHRRIGTTDLVKRATVAASEVTTEEFADGFGRVERLCAWLRPKVLYLVGLQGWRAAVDRRARPGLQPDPLGGVPVYLAPSTSGLNASSQLDAHVEHLRAAAALAPTR